MAYSKRAAQGRITGLAYRAPSGRVSRENAPRQKYTEEENQWLLDLHASRPDLTWRDLSRRFIRQTGKSRSDSSIAHFCKNHTNKETS